MRYRIDMCYDGAPFCGWQIQPGDPSVQETLEQALSTLLRTPVQVTGAGRTDTGVSASGYVAHFDFNGPVPAPVATDGALDCRQLAYKLNAILPKSIAIQGISVAPPGFHARFSATRRHYTYYIHRVKDPFLEGRSYFFGYPGLDFELMNSTAQQLLGRHDFSCFEKAGGDNATSICTVYSALWSPAVPPASPVPGSPAPGAGAFWRFDIEADRFLRNMVRAIVGTLLEVGRGRRSPENFASLVLPPSDAPKESRRSAAGESAPAHALFLSRIDY